MRKARLESHVATLFALAASARTALRNGHRTRTLSTTAGDLELRIPKLRTGSFFPSLLERRRRVDQALFAVVMEAYLHGVSTRKVDDLVTALGADTGISKSEANRRITNKGVFVNHVQVTDAKLRITTTDLVSEAMLVLRSSKKDIHLVRPV